jgi:hypothetical protein
MLQKKLHAKIASDTNWNDTPLASVCIYYLYLEVMIRDNDVRHATDTKTAETNNPLFIQAAVN